MCSLCCTTSLNNALLGHTYAITIFTHTEQEAHGTRTVHCLPQAYARHSFACAECIWDNFEKHMTKVLDTIAADYHPAHKI